MGKQTFPSRLLAKILRYMPQIQSLIHLQTSMLILEEFRAEICKWLDNLLEQFAEQYKEDNE